MLSFQRIQLGFCLPNAMLILIHLPTSSFVSRYILSDINGQKILKRDGGKTVKLICEKNGDRGQDSNEFVMVDHQGATLRILIHNN